MSYVTPAPVSPAIVATDVASQAGLATTTLAALTIYLYAFELQAPTTFSGAKWRTGSTQTGSADIGIYNSGGTLLANLGGVIGAASTSNSQAFSGGNITLAPGLYYAAFAAEIATDTYVGINAPIAGGLIESRYRVATNQSTNAHPTVLNAATGAINAPAATKQPAFALTVVGGI